MKLLVVPHQKQLKKLFSFLIIILLFYNNFIIVGTTNNFRKPEKWESLLTDSEIISGYFAGYSFVLSEKINMIATAYDLSVKSCGKPRTHKLYGITRSGTRATRNRTVAVDPKVIPLNSVIYIEFPEKYSYRNGFYVAEDTGKAIKGNRIDVFFGEDKPNENIIHKKCLEFGKQNVVVYLIDLK